MMKVTVLMRTIERLNRARNWARLLVHGYLETVWRVSRCCEESQYSIVFQSQDRHCPHSVLPKSSSAACSRIFFFLTMSPSFSLWSTSTSRMVMVRIFVEKMHLITMIPLDNT